MRSQGSLDTKWVSNKDARGDRSGYGSQQEFPGKKGGRVCFTIMKPELQASGMPEVTIRRRRGARTAALNSKA
jgi:hypothetical protein